MVYPVFHITEHNIRLGAFPCMEHFHAQVLASDPSPYQRGIKHNGFHKTVFGSPQYLILFRLSHPPGGIGPCINQKAFFVAFNKKGKNPGHNKVSNLVPVIQ